MSLFPLPPRKRVRGLKQAKLSLHSLPWRSATELVTSLVALECLWTLLFFRYSGHGGALLLHLTLISVILHPNLDGRSGQYILALWSFTFYW